MMLYPPPTWLTGSVSTACSPGEMNRLMMCWRRRYTTAGYPTVIEIVEAAANQRKSFRGKVFDPRCKIESAIEPGFNGVLIRRKHVRQMVPRQRTEMVINDLSGRQLPCGQSWRQDAPDKNPNKKDSSRSSPHPTITP